MLTPTFANKSSDRQRFLQTVGSYWIVSDPQSDTIRYQARDFAMSLFAASHQQRRTSRKQPIQQQGLVVEDEAPKRRALRGSWIILEDASKKYAMEFREYPTVNGISGFPALRFDGLCFLLYLICSSAVMYFLQEFRAAAHLPGQGQRQKNRRSAQTNRQGPRVMDTANAAN